MPENDDLDGERTGDDRQQPDDPDDCATLAIREIRTNAPTAEALEERIKTIDRIIGELKK